MKQSRQYYKLAFIFISIAILSFAVLAFSTAHAQSVDELKNKINASNDNIRQLNEEIKKYQSEIDALGKQASSLKNTLASLDLSRKKLEADLAVTRNKIDSTNLEIKELSLQIDDKSERIDDGKRVIAQSLNTISQMESDSLIETFLSSRTLAEAWNNTDELNTLQSGVKDRIDDLKNVKISLEDNKKKTETKKAQLVSLQNDLANQKKILAETVKEKNTILAETKNTEANYKKVLISKEVQKDAFEKELTDLESSLKFAIDPNSIPSSGSGVLKWPLDKVRITQYFGNTEFATKNPSVYKGTGHNGVDFNASIGTPVKASAGGIVTNVINTSIAQRCGYGKWISIKHPNGLSTLYSHLSLPTASVGDSVTTGEVIGYSGNTGFTTGPHLHFGVYVTKGLQTIESKSCPGIMIPYAAFNAYLNPLSYL